MSLESDIKNLIKAVTELTVAIQAQGGVISHANGNVPEHTQQPTPQQTTGTPQPNSTGAPQPIPVVPQPTNQVQQPAAGGITIEALMAKAGNLAQLLGPHASLIQQELARLGAARMTELAVEHYGAFDGWLTTKTQEQASG